MLISKFKLRVYVCAALILLMTITIGFTYSKAYASSGISVNVDGQQIQFTQEPIIKNGRTLVPLRGIFEAMNMKVNWNQSTKSIIAYKDDVIIKLQISNKNAFVGNDKLGYIDTVLDVEPQIINSTTLVPVRFIGEVSGADVLWNQKTNTVLIDSKTNRYFGIKTMIIDNIENKYLGYLSNSYDTKDGFGRTNYSTGDLYIGNYIGNYSSNLKCGQGIFTFADGEKYVGEWLNDDKSGQGTYTFKNGAKYVGQFENDRENGQGTGICPDGTKFIGKFKDGTINGQGIAIYSSGDKYVGEFKDGLLNGQGTYTFNNGDKYVGEFKDGEINGQGTLTQMDGIIQKGIWVDGELIN